MYAFAYDRATSNLVGLKTGDTCTDADYERLLESTNRLMADAPAGTTPNRVLVIDPGQQPPSPRWRRRLAEARPATRPFRSVIVTPSLVARGILTAMSWMRPPTPGQQIVGRATFEQAVAWLEAEGGEGVRPILFTLYERLRRRPYSTTETQPVDGSEARLRAHARVPPGTGATRKKAVVGIP